MCLKFVVTAGSGTNYESSYARFAIDSLKTLETIAHR